MAGRMKNLLLFGLLYSLLLACQSEQLTLVAPNVFHYGASERVLVGWEGVGYATAVEVYLEAWPDRQQSFSSITQLVHSKSTTEFEVTVNYDDLPEGDALAREAGNRYVYVVARIIDSHVRREVRVLLSKTFSNIFVQTDKPIFTPNQRVQVTVYTTDINNKPKQFPLRVDILTPKGIIVDRQEKTSLSMSTEGEPIDGLFRHIFYLGLKPVVGNWSITAHAGLQTQEGIQYLQSSTVAFQVEEYVLPTYACSLLDVPEYIREDDTSITISVRARYSHGKPVSGTVSARFGIADGNKASYIVTKLASLKNGMHHFTLRLQDMYSQDPYFSFSGRAAGKHLFIRAECREQSSGEKKEAVSMAAMFVTSPYTVNFERSPNSFTVGLPLLFQFELKHANGGIAANTPIKLFAWGFTRSMDRHALTLGIHGQMLTTDGRGVGYVTYNVQSTTHSVQIEVLEISGATIGTRRLTKLDRAHAIGLNIPRRIYKMNEHVDVEVHLKGGPFKSLVWMVLRSGELVSSGSRALQGSFGMKLLRLSVTATMVPSARLLAYAVTQADTLTADAIWIDVEDACASGLNVSTSKDKYDLGQDTVGRLLVHGSAGAHVMLQMIDRAVLMLNPERTLTKNKMFGTLEALDLGCPSVLGSTASDVFRRAGLVVSSKLHQISGHINAGLRLNDAGCGVDDFRLDADCCRFGENEPIHQSCQSLEAAFIAKHHPSEQCLSIYQTCCHKNDAKRHRPVLKIRYRMKGNKGRRRMIHRGRHIRRMKSTHSSRVLSKTVVRQAVQTGLPGLPGMRGAAGPQPDFSRRDMYDIDMNIHEHGVRRNFPESQLIGPITISETGERSVKFTIPDSITTWSVEGVELSQTTGMCVADTHEFTVVKKFFLKVRLPYQAVRGEQLLLTATFHNEGLYAEEVELVMRGVAGVCSKAIPGEWSRHSRYVEAREAVTVSWPVVPLKHGDFPIEVVAMTPNLEVLDAVIRKLTVVPEGVSSSKSESFVVEPSASSTTDTIPQQCNYVKTNHLRCYLSLDLPSQYVPHSASGVVSITPNTFGPAADLVVNGLADKLRMPSGCGEQVMIHTAPGVYAYKYMLETDTMTSEAQTKFPEIVKEGVNRILAYLKNNGGVGVWTNTPASTWLTSFVLKVFARASALVGRGVVDDHLLNSAVNFLYGQQVKSGATAGRFNEYSEVSRHHGEMIGAVKDTDLTLTAFVSIALMEVDSPLQVHKDSYRRSIDYLAGQVTQSKTAYEAALVSYALSMSPVTSHRMLAFNKLKTFAKEIDTGGLKLRYFPGPEGTALKIHVETAAYAILAALRSGEIDYCYRIVLWLHQQRRNQAIFQTTQDTVVALQALSEYSVATQSRSTDLLVSISLQRVTQHGVSRRPRGADNMTFVVTNEDKNREFIFPIDEEQVEGMLAAVVDVSGHGIAQVTMQTLFNLHQESNCAFDIKISKELRASTEHEDSTNDPDFEDLFEVEEDPAAISTPPVQLSELTLTVCAKHLNPWPTEMAIMDIGLLTGFQPHIKTLQLYVDNGTISFFEISDKSVVIYLPSISHEKQVCVVLDCIQEEPVANLSPAPVVVYDYYNRESECSTFYSDSSAGSESLSINYHNDKCFEGACSPCYGTGSGYATPWTLEQLTQAMCTPKVIYVLRVVVVSIEQTDHWNLAYVNLITVMKQGVYMLEEGFIVQVATYKGCTCPALSTPGKQYLLIGRQEDIIEDQPNAGEYIIRLTLDHDSYVEPWQRKRGAHWDLRTYMSRDNPCPF